ncbi:phosphatase PAP2 family protein [Arachidicoccus ginsenosidivorans]|uniref:Phosphatase PAP2 family protein n=2 Tax=Arachidicoccus ginsenosidivorans TaxID=496057 RepID=A0A5B8VLS9_9BACT|nr:phosphatase PAP2 family protein [Arachidicoccus ginsenosidivorans]
MPPISISTSTSTFAAPFLISRHRRRIRNLYLPLLMAVVMTGICAAIGQPPVFSSTPKCDSASVLQVTGIDSTIPGRAESADSLRFATARPVINLRPLNDPFTPHLRQLICPGLLAAAGMATYFNKKEGLKNELVEYRTNHFSNFRTKVDNYLQFSPLIANYALEAFGVPGKTDPFNQAMLTLKSEALMLGVTYLLKTTVREQRPDGSNHQSFPSGHTAQAFTAATLLCEQYGYRYKWLPYVAYTVAGGTGLLRMANNKHYICDVFMGAAIGILSVKVAYWTHHAFSVMSKKHRVSTPIQ